MGIPRILIVGGGFVGLTAALRLERAFDRDEAEITLVNPNTFMLYQPLLPEVASGSIEPRHAALPLRTALRHTDLVTGRLIGLDHGRRTAEVLPLEGPAVALEYDHVVIGLGGMSRRLPVPGIEEHAVGFKSVSEAIWLRNQVLSRLEVAEATEDPQVRERALTFVFVGAGYAGVEALAELEDMARSACRQLRRVAPENLRWVLVEATDGTMPEIDESLSRYALRELRRRGVEVRLETQVEEVAADTVRLSDSSTLPTETVVWMTGVEPHPVLGELGLPLDDKGRLSVDATLQVEGAPGAWGAGDCAAVPDIAKGGFLPPTAQHASREARALADNLAAVLAGRDPEPLHYRGRGEMVTLGRHKGVAQLKLRGGITLRGFLPWALRRAYYLTSMPSANRRARILADWLVSLPFRRDLVHLEALHGPAESLREPEEVESAG